MKRNSDLKTPWSSVGLLHHPGPRKVEEDGETWPNVREWRGNDEFEATLVLRGTERGRSAAFFRWQVLGGDLQTGLFLPMFMTDVGHLIVQGKHLEPGGVVSGRWFVVKRGQNYGITPVASGDEAVPVDQEQATETVGASGRP